MDKGSHHHSSEHNLPPSPWSQFNYEASCPELDRMTFLSEEERRQLRDNCFLAQLKPLLTPSWATTVRNAVGKSNFLHLLQGIRPEFILSLPEERFEERIERINTSSLAREEKGAEPLLGVQIELLKQSPERFETLMELAPIIGVEKTRQLLFSLHHIFYTTEIPKEAIVHASKCMSASLFEIFLDHNHGAFLSWLFDPEAQKLIDERVETFGSQWWAEINSNRMADQYACADLFFNDKAMDLVKLMNKRHLSLLQKNFMTSFLAHADSEDKVIQIMDFVEKHLPDTMLASLDEVRLYEFKQIPVDFLRALMESLTEEQIKQFLEDKETFEYIKNASKQQRTQTGIPLKKFELFEKRDAVPVEYEPGVPDRKKQEIQEMIDVLGIEPLLRKLASKVIIEAQREQEESNGLYCSPSAEIHLRAYGEMGQSAPIILTHEIGHALNEYLMALPEAQFILSKFALTTIFSVHRYSPYAEAYGENEGHNSENYLSEVFAEDFALFLATPDYLPAQKRIFFEEIFDRYFPTIDYQLIRRKMASLFGNFYGLSLDEVVEETECDTIAWYRKELEKEDLPTRHYLTGAGFSGSDMDYYQMTDEDYD